MAKQFKPGDHATLIEPVRGYSNVEIVEDTGTKLLVRTSSGMEIEIYEDELEEND